MISRVPSPQLIAQWFHSLTIKQKDYVLKGQSWFSKADLTVGLRGEQFGWKDGRKLTPAWLDVRDGEGLPGAIVNG